MTATSHDVVLCRVLKSDQQDALKSIAQSLSAGPGVSDSLMLKCTQITQTSSVRSGTVRRWHAPHGRSTNCRCGKPVGTLTLCCVHMCRAPGELIVKTGKPVQISS